MEDFTKLTDPEIFHFIEKHIDEFTDDPADDFAARMYEGYKRNILFAVAFKDAFAVLVKRLRYAYPEPIDAQLVYIYTSPTSRGEGAATKLLDEIKKSHLDESGLSVTCCGSDRKRFFEKNGFQVVDGDEALYSMHYTPVN